MSSTYVSKLSTPLTHQLSSFPGDCGINLHHLRDILLCDQLMCRRPINVPLFEIDRPIEGHIRRRDLGVVGL